MWIPRGKAIKIVDGDTFHAVVDIGFNVTIKMVIRLAKVNTPEKNQPGWQEAKDFVENSLKDTFFFDSHGKDKYGRELGLVSVNGMDLSKALIEKGLAKAYE